MGTSAGALGAAGRYERGNILVDGLPQPDRERLAERLTVARTDVPDCVVSHGQPFGDVLFPIDSIFSITAELRLGNVYELAAVGREGLIGAELAFGIDTAPRTVMTQVDGCYAQLTRDAFAEFIGESSAFARAVQRHMIRRLFIAEQFIACNFAHSLTERCARWVLMLQDETGRDRFGLRRDFLGMMLGIEPRAAATAAAPLAAVGALRYADESMSVQDRNALLDASCECYEEQRRFAPVAA